MQQLLSKYIYKNYYELLKNEELNLELARLGWSKPAIIPRQNILFSNRLIRKYLTRPSRDFLNDFEFQRILCKVGYSGPACPGTTTTSSTTTSTTTAPEVIIDVVNNSATASLTSFTQDGLSVQLPFPIAPGVTTSGLMWSRPVFINTVATLSGSFGSVTSFDTTHLLECKNSPSPLSFTVLTNGPFHHTITISDLICPTTTSTTTTSTTTVGPQTVQIFNDAIGLTITNITFDGNPLGGVSFPIAPGATTSGTTSIFNLGTTVVVSVTGIAAVQCVEVDDSDGGANCLPYTTAGDYSFPGIIANGSDVFIFTYDTGCAC